MERICKPAVASAWIADSRPEPGPCTRTCTRRTPRLSASRAACSAATVAANGVDFFEPWNPALPEEPHVMVFPCMSVIVMSVLLNVAVMWAMPAPSTTFLGREAGQQCGPGRAHRRHHRDAQQYAHHDPAHAGERHQVETLG